MTPSIGLAGDVAQNSPFLVTNWGSQLALGFRGDEAFINRCFNWAHNFSVTRGTLHWPYDKGCGHTGNLAYIVVRESRDANGVITKKSREFLTEGLAAQFRAEIMMTREIAPITDTYDDEIGPVTEWDESAVDTLAARRAESFMAEHTVTSDFLIRYQTSLAPIYEVGGDWRQPESED